MQETEVFIFDASLEYEKDVSFFVGRRRIARNKKWEKGNGKELLES